MKVTCRYVIATQKIIIVRTRKSFPDNFVGVFNSWQTVSQAFVAPNFTAHGFGLARGPEELSKALRDGIRGGLERGEARLEHQVEVIEGPQCVSRQSCCIDFNNYM
jgi:hypothetical protein